MQNQGITMLQIVISIVVMIILASVAILYGSGIPKETNIAVVYSEIKEIKSAIAEAKLLNQLKVSGESLTIFKEINVPKINNSNYSKVIGNDASGDFYYLDFTSSKELKNVLEIENIKNDYILELNNLNIYSVNGVTITTGDEITTKYKAEDIEYYFRNIYK